MEDTQNFPNFPFERASCIKTDVGPTGASSARAADRPTRTGLFGLRWRPASPLAFVSPARGSVEFRQAQPSCKGRNHRTLPASDATISNESGIRRSPEATETPLHRV